MALAVAVEYLVLEVLIIKINGGYFSVSPQNQNVYGSGVLQVRRKPIKIRRFINKLLHALSLSLKFACTFSEPSIVRSSLLVFIYYTGEVY